MPQEALHPNTLNTQTELLQLLDDEFEYNGHMEHIIMSHLPDNPNHNRFVGRVLTLVGWYGFESLGHYFNEIPDRIARDAKLANKTNYQDEYLKAQKQVMNPLTLLNIGIYLSKITTSLFSQKRDFIEELKAKGDYDAFFQIGTEEESIGGYNRFEIFWHSVVFPFKGVVRLFDFPDDVHNSSDPYNQTTSPDEFITIKGMPRNMLLSPSRPSDKLRLPDLEFCEKLAQLNQVPDTNTITYDEFRAIIRPQLLKIFGDPTPKDLRKKRRRELVKLFGRSRNYLINPTLSTTPESTILNPNEGEMKSRKFRREGENELYRMQPAIDIDKIFTPDIFKQDQM